ncbi:hypothetical protein TWF506_004200 [Arthrobotrys conoides]|uniref:Uncharacterized protein n=1 Tax=Arthrobotrys conoides TaxID=74498 RepID=A0AAN8NBC5_9PEZI
MNLLYVSGSRELCKPGQLSYLLGHEGVQQFTALVDIKFIWSAMRAPCIRASAMKQGMNCRWILPRPATTAGPWCRCSSILHLSLGKSIRLVALGRALICAPWVPKIAALNLTCKWYSCRNSIDALSPDSS